MKPLHAHPPTVRYEKNMIKLKIFSLTHLISTTRFLVLEFRFLVLVVAFKMRQLFGLELMMN